MFLFGRLSAASCLLALTMLSACASKQDDPQAQATAGITWTADGTQPTDPAPQVASSGTNIDIIGSVGSAPTTTTIHLGIPTQVGSYAISGTNTVTADYIIHSSGSNVSYLASSGTVTISGLTATRLTGTFSFTAYNYSNGANNPLVKTITNGRFDVAR